MNRILKLCEELPVRKIQAGESLMTQGGTRLYMAVLKSGKVEIVKDRHRIAVIEEPGAIFGEMAVILRTRHTATVRTIEDSEFFEIEDPDAFLWRKGEFHFEMLRILATRLESVNRGFAGRMDEVELRDKAVEFVSMLLHGTPVDLGYPEESESLN